MGFGNFSGLIYTVWGCSKECPEEWWMVNLTFAKFVSLCNGHQLNQLQKIVCYILNYNLHIILFTGVWICFYWLGQGHKLWCLEEWWMTVVVGCIYSTMRLSLPDRIACPLGPNSPINAVMNWRWDELQLATATEIGGVFFFFW